MILKIFKFEKPEPNGFAQVFQITNKEHFDSLFFFKSDFEENKTIQKCFILDGENIIEGPLVFVFNFKQVFDFEKELNPILKLKLIKNGFDLIQPSDSEISEFIKNKIFKNDN